MMLALKLASLLSVIQLITGDVYMHNPRGSNDRNCERNVNRNNGNRLFDSENNNNGGYACQRPVGDETMQDEAGTKTFTSSDGTDFTQTRRIYYYEGSILPIEWTNQHGCGGNSKVSCELVLQYACEDTLDPRVDNFWPWVNNKAEASTTYYGKQHFRSTTNIAAPRDGVPIDVNDAATDTINDDEASAIPSTPTTRRYGMQESFDYYELCQRTKRNTGLYTADQLVRRNDRRGTRQNPNGNRHGFECPEERDYYPWWAPSPWVDIAVLTDSASDDVCYPSSTGCTKRCTYYMNNTMNFNKKGYCDVNHTNPASTVQTKLNSNEWRNNVWFNARAPCEAAGYVWYEVSHADNLNLGANNFVCAKTQFSRVNQLGNGRADTIVSQDEAASVGVVADHVKQGVNANRFMWTIPTIPTPKKSTYFPSMTSAYKACILRIRYNVSSADFQQWPKDAVDPNAGIARMVDSKNNSKSVDDINTPLHQNPYIYIGPGDSETTGDMFVSLKVNTNQYGRTFQDRSYVFSIKPKPTANAAANHLLDTPAVNYAAMNTALTNGGKIYNVNVRGKRGNIVQVYPSVEYDFVPNALALSTNDMIHFQWTGSDYNPRRGCNDATGGPPDLNTYSTDANANLNSRADRSNVVLTNHMANNVPKDYLGYDHTTTALNFTQKEAYAMNTVLENAPCYDPSTDSTSTAVECYNTMMRLAYLNQQLDGGSLVLRGGAKCLTETQLNQLDQETARNHPLNCAKMNAKPFPYFDGGLLMMNKNGWFPYFSSRNNNFSNRQQIGIICVGPSCKVNNGTGVLQDNNPAVSGKSLVRAAASTCADTANSGTGSNANGATSCLNAIPTANVILTKESFTVQEGDNDLKGDGTPNGCGVLTFSNSVVLSPVEEKVALAIGLLFVGLFSAWLAYYLYNRYQARQAGTSKFRYDAAWQGADAIELSASSPGTSPGRSAPPSPFKSNPSTRRVDVPAPPVSNYPNKPTRPVSPIATYNNNAGFRAASPTRGGAASSSSNNLNAGSGAAPTGGAKAGRVMSTKRTRPKYEEMI